MACHTPPLNKVKKQGEMPLPSLSPIPLKKCRIQNLKICRVELCTELLDAIIPTLPNACSLAPPKKAQLRAPLSPLQTAWTGFDPNLYSGGSLSAGPALVEIATARSFILNRGIVTDTMSATPLEPG